MLAEIDRFRVLKINTEKQCHPYPPHMGLRSVPHCNAQWIQDPVSGSITNFRKIFLKREQLCAQHLFGFWCPWIPSRSRGSLTKTHGSLEGNSVENVTSVLPYPWTIVSVDVIGPTVFIFLYNKITTLSINTKVPYKIQ